MQLSYAQNLEDYHLDLMFAGQDGGTYVDVGGGHPVADNVSFWFYLKGWRGLVVEPQQALADIYAHVRPRDRTVSCLAGRAEGEAEFHVVEKLHGFSSTVREHAEGAAEFGAAFTTIPKPVRTLAALIAEAGLGAIDFLKIDVEGAEADVLAGMDFAAPPPARDPAGGGGPRQHGRRIGGAGSAICWPRATGSPSSTASTASTSPRRRSDLAARLPAEPAPWDSVKHLWDCGRAPERSDHPDHVLARTLMEGFFATLPSLDPALLRRLIERGLNGVRPHGSDLASVAGRTGGSDPMAPRSPCSAPPNSRGRQRRAADLAALLETDQLRAALGRIACMYDGGHLLE